MSWQYISNGKQYAASNIELRFNISTGNVKPTDKVLGPGMTDWIPASEAADLLDTPVPGPPADLSATSEGEFTVLLGNTLIWLSILSAIICIFVFGRVDVPTGLYGDGTEARWVPMLIAVFVASGLNGAFFGFLLAKIGKILTKLEK